MATLKELTDILKNSNLTDQQIGELLSSLTAMQKENEDIEKGKSKIVLPPELLALLEKCTLLCLGGKISIVATEQQNKRKCCWIC